MIQTALASFLTASILTLSTVSPSNAPQPQSFDGVYTEQSQNAQGKTELGSAVMSLDNRLEVKSANDVYKDNILLNLAYLSGEVKSKEDIDWDKIRKPFILQFSLEPGQGFAYHDAILDDYKENIVLTTNSHFNASDGYKTDGNLYGMGVCHLASLIHMAAQDAGLDSVAPTNHDFAVIREIPREYGVSIYSSPGSFAASARQNLYIKNNLDSKVTFRFDYDGVNLKVAVLKG